MDREEGIPLPKKRKFDGGCMRILKKRLPILEWSRKYDRITAVADLVAGVTLGLTLVPQSIAYASLASLPVQYGLYSAFMGTMLYTFLGTVKEVSIGPTSLMALLTLQTCRALPAPSHLAFVALLTFLSGCVVLLMGVLRLGFLVDLISPSVTSGFTSGTAVIIVGAQLKGLLGLSFSAESVLENAMFIYSKWREVRIADCTLAAVCCTVLLLLRKLKDLPVSPKRSALKKALWLVSISRNAIVVCAAAAFAYSTHDPLRPPLVKLSGHVEAGLPSLSLPPFSITVHNETLGFAQMVHELGVGVLMLPIVMVLANVAIAKAFTAGSRVDATQEMVTLGLVNVAGSLVHAMPTCGAFTRSAVSHSSGVRTPAAGFYSGIITLLALNFMTEYFYFIPKACLSSVLICAVMFMIDFSIVVRLWRRNKPELCVLALTFAVCVSRTVELAVLAGALASLALLLRGTMRPTVHLHAVKVSEGEAVRVRPTLALVYLNVERFAAQVQATAERVAPAPILMDCSALSIVDYTATQVVERLLKKFKEADQKLVFYNASPEVMRVLEHMEGVNKRALRALTATEALNFAGGADSHEMMALLREHDVITQDKDGNV